MIYRKDGNDLYIQYNEEYLEECQVIVQGFFLADSEGNLTNAIDAIRYEDNEKVVTIEEIFSIVGYAGPTGKTMIEKVEAMDAEQRRKILAKHDFLEEV